MNAALQGQLPAGSKPCTGSHRQAIWLALAGSVLAFPAVAQTGPGDSDLIARAALAALGVAALPGSGANTISILGTDGEQMDFFSTQLGGGTSVGRDDRLYVEGYLAYQNYAPVYILPTPDATLVDTRWSSLAVTGGLGWNVDLTDDLVLRPAALATVGHVFGRAVLDDLLPVGAPLQSDGLFEDGMFVGGLGGSISLEYDTDFAGGNIDLRARQSWMKLVPLGEEDRLDVSSIANATNLFGRLTLPIESSMPNGMPWSSVWEGSYTRFWGDQAVILRTDWLATLGTGVEVNLPSFAGLDAPAGRLTVRYVFGESFEGVSLGLGLDF